MVMVLDDGLSMRGWLVWANINEERRQSFGSLKWGDVLY
jgi:hypothetical protein